jgi:PhoH-like ATPase
VKTILTRVGENSKIVLVGDPQQIDHPYLDEYSNGLSYAVERLKGEKMTGHVKLVKGERSSLARLAADLL